MPVKAVQTGKSEMAADSLARQQDVAASEQTERHSGIAASLLRLQRVHGNRYVQRAIHSKNGVSRPGYACNPEADQITEGLVNMPAVQRQGEAEQQSGPEGKEGKQKSEQEKLPQTMPAPVTPQQLPIDEQETKAA